MPRQPLYPHIPKGVEPKIIIKRLTKGIEGYFDDRTNIIYISSDLSLGRQAEIQRHELEHYYQRKTGTLPQAKYVSPRESIAKFMDYLTDPQEVSARAAEKGEVIPTIWDEVFKVKAQIVSGEYTSLQVDRIVPSEITRIEPDKSLPGMTYAEKVHNTTLWHQRRLLNQLRISDPKPIRITNKSIRIYFKNHGNGIIAADMLKKSGIDASSIVPFSVDVILNSENTAKIQNLAIYKLTEGRG